METPLQHEKYHLTFIGFLLLIQKQKKEVGIRIKRTS